MFVLMGCPPDEDTDDPGSAPEQCAGAVLDPEPPGAPTEVAVGRLGCIGNNDPEPPSGSALELTGYVRTLADPTAQDDPPVAEVEAFDAAGNSLGAAFSDPTKAGRVALSVPVQSTGFTGYVEVTEADHIDLRFQTSRAVTDTKLTGWAWLLTAVERDARAADLGVSLDEGTGILVGSVHDCDSLGLENAVVTVDDASDGVLYVEGWDLSASRTFTSSSGRFAMANLAPGPVTVRAYAREAEDCDLTLISEIETEIVADAMTEVALEVR